MRHPVLPASVLGESSSATTGHGFCSQSGARLYLSLVCLNYRIILLASDITPQQRRVLNSPSGSAPPNSNHQEVTSANSTVLKITFDDDDWGNSTDLHDWD